MEKEYYDVQAQYMNEIRSMRHDMQAHMIILQHYLDAENYEKARAYLGAVRQHQNIWRLTEIDTGNDVVNAIVRDTLNRSKKPIVFEMKGRLPENFPMEEYDICTLFANVFSNATEACEKLSRASAYIHMRVQKEEKRYRIMVENPIEWSLEERDGILLTTKEDKESHGFGTRNMQRVVKQYEGKITYQMKEGIFGVEVILPVKI